MQTFLEASDLNAITALIDDLKAQLAQKTQQLADATNLISASCDVRLSTQTGIINQQVSLITSLQNTLAQNQTALTQSQLVIAQQRAQLRRLSMQAARGASYIPLYSWNCAGYEQVIALKQKFPEVPIIAAINPSSGPGTSKSTTIDAAVKAMQAADVMVLGYVGTNYGSELTKRQYPVGNPWPSDTPRDLESVKADMDKYVQWYGVDGFMEDDYSNKQNITLPDGATKDVYNTFYLPLNTYARTLAGIKFIKGNMGTKPLYMPLVDMCDNVCVYEGQSNPTLAQLQNNTLNGQLRNKATVVVYNYATLDPAVMTQMAQYAKYYYCSDGGYNKPPTYYSTLINTLAGL